ncbi:LOW QUALITY PROTEIN: proline-rich protein 32 [Hipposideros larvatus]
METFLIKFLHGLYCKCIFSGCCISIFINLFISIFANLGGDAPSPIAVPADENGKQEPCHNAPLQCLKDGGVLGHPPVLLRPPFSVLTVWAREELDRPCERTRTRTPVYSARGLKQPGSPPVVEEESLATAEVNSSKGLAGWRQMGQHSINVSQEFTDSLPALIEGTRVSNVGTETGGNNASFYVDLPGQGFFPPRDPHVRGLLRIPTTRSGTIMELPPGNTRMASNERLAPVSFSLGVRNPVGYWSRPISLSSCTSGLPACTTAHCFIPPQPLSFNPFLTMPTAFASPVVFSPPVSFYFASFLSWGMSTPASSKRITIYWQKKGRGDKETNK